MDENWQQRLKRVAFSRIRRRHFSLYSLMALAALFILNGGPANHEAVIVKNLLEWHRLFEDTSVKPGRYLDAAVWAMCVIGLLLWIVVLHVRRLHDLGLSWYFVIVAFALQIGIPVLLALQIAYLDSVFLTFVCVSLLLAQALFFFLMPGRPEENRFGPPASKNLFYPGESTSFLARPLLQNTVIGLGIFGSFIVMLLYIDEANRDLRRYNWELYSFDRAISRPLDTVTVIVATANIRAAPNTSSTILRAVPRGTVLERRGSIGEWIPVRTLDGSINGYVRADLVEISR